MSHEPESQLADDLLGHERWLRALVRTLVFDGDAADDVVQDTWLEVLKGKRKDLASPRGWLTVVARRLIGEHARRDRLRRTREPIVARSEIIDQDAAVLRRLERQKDLVAAVQSLEQNQKSVVVMRYFDGLEPSEIADRLGIEPTTVRNRLHRAMKELREKLDKKYGDRTTWGIAFLALARPHGRDVLRATLFSPSKSLVAAMLVVMFASSLTFVRNAFEFGQSRDDRSSDRKVDAFAGAESSVRRAERPAIDQARTSVAPPTSLPNTDNHPATDLATIRGIVQTSAALGIPDCEVIVIEPAGPWFTSYDWFERHDRRTPREISSTRTDGGGRFSIEVPKSSPYRLAARRLGFGMVVKDSTSISPSAETTFTLIRTSIARGIVVDEKNVPVGGAEIEVRQGDVVAQAFRTPTTTVYRSSTDGTFEIDLLTREPVGSTQLALDRIGSLIENIPPRLFVRKKGYVEIAGLPLVDRPPDADGRAILVMPRSRRIRFQLQEDGRAAKLARPARLLLRDNRIPWQGVAEIDRDGRGEIQDAPDATRFEAVLDCDGFILPRKASAVRIGAQNSIVPIECPQGDGETAVVEIVRGGSIKGRVVAASDGAPIAGISVVAFPDIGSVAAPSHVRRAVTDADGRYRLDGVEDTFVEVRIESPFDHAILDEDTADDAIYLADLSPGDPIRGFAIVRREEPLAWVVRALPDREVSDVDFRIRAPIPFHARVVGDDGRPIEGVVGRFERGDDERKSWPRSLDEKRRLPDAVSTKSGDIAWDAIPSDPSGRIIFRKEGYPPLAVKDLRGHRSKEKALEIRLVRHAPISILAIDDGGTPIDALRIALATEESRDIGPNVDEVACVTGPDGRALVTTLAPGKLRLELDRAFDRGFDTSLVQDMRIDYRGDQPIEIKLDLPRLFSVSGRVVRKSGEPVPFAAVIARTVASTPNGTRVFRSRTDRYGAFTIEIPANDETVIDRLVVPSSVNPSARSRTLAPLQRTVLLPNSPPPDIVVDD